MESETVVAARRQLDALGSEHRERLSLAAKRVDESDARAKEASQQQVANIHKLVKRLRESAANRDRLERQNRETFEFGRRDDVADSSGKRWPGTPESVKRKQEDDAVVSADAGAPERRKMRSWEQSWHSDDEPQQAAPAPEPAQPTRRPARARREEVDDEDMSSQRWLG